MQRQFEALSNRRQFLGQTAAGLGLAALGPLAGRLSAADTPDWGAGPSALKGLPHFAPKAKRVIHLFMNGGPSHMDLFDPKPKLKELTNTELTSIEDDIPRESAVVAGERHHRCNS